MKVTEEMYAAIPGLVASGKTREEIAAQYEVSINCLQVLCSRRGISLRKAPESNKPRKRRRRNDVTVRVVINQNVLSVLTEAATKHGRPTPAALAADLLEKISTDKLFLAVLDEDAA